MSWQITKESEEAIRSTPELQHLDTREHHGTLGLLGPDGQRCCLKDIREGVVKTPREYLHTTRRTAALPRNREDEEKVHLMQVAGAIYPWILAAPEAKSRLYEHGSLAPRATMSELLACLRELEGGK